MSNGVDLYKEFIDNLVEHRPSMAGTWIGTSKKWPEIDDKHRRINKSIATLNEKQKELFAELLDASYDAVIHNTLAYIKGKYVDGLKISIGGVEMAKEPIDTECITVLSAGVKAISGRMKRYNIKGRAPMTRAVLE